MADGLGENLWTALDKAREWWLPMAGAAPAGFAAWLLGRRKAGAEAGRIEAEAEKAEAEAEAIVAEAMTKRFAVLIDGYERRISEMTEQFKVLAEGYEGRIKDLTSEVHSLRDEVKALRMALDQRTRDEAERARRGAGLAGGRAGAGDVRDMGGVT